MEPVTFHYRGNIPLGTPTNTSGSTRPLMLMNRPIHTIHYTGLRPDQIWFTDGDGVFDNIEDVYRFMGRLEEVARASGKPFEYNTCIPIMSDNSSHVIAYADEYVAAHSAGENTIAHGTLFMAGTNQSLNSGAIYAFQWWNAVLETTGRLTSDSQITPHKDMPNAQTACPGAAILVDLASLRAPYIPPAPPTVEPEVPNVGEDFIMYIVKPGPEIQHLTDVHFACFDSGVVRHASGPDTEKVSDVRECHGTEHFNQLARAANFMGGAEIQFIS